MASIVSNRLPSRPDDRKVVPLIVEQYGVSSRMAMAMAAGALSNRMDTIALARQYKLISRIDTAEARQKGLLQ